MIVVRAQADSNSLIFQCKSIPIKHRLNKTTGHPSALLIWSAVLCTTVCFSLILFRENQVLVPGDQEDVYSWVTAGRESRSSIDHSFITITDGPTTTPAPTRTTMSSFRLHDDPMQEKILWSCVSRNATILVEAGNDPFDGAVSEAARAIFQKSSTAGWEYHSTSQEKSKPVTSTSSLYYGRNESHGYYSNSKDDDDSSEEQDEDDAYDSDDDEDTASQCFLLRRRPSFRVPKLKAIKFHVFEQTKRDDEDEEEEDQWIVKELSCWVFAAVYNPEATTWKGRSSQNILRDVKSFVQKLVVLTELPRSYEESWRTGGQLACQGSFAATLLQRMQEVTYLGEHAQVVVDDDSIVQQEDANELMKANITAILDQQDQLQDMRDRSYKLVRTVTQLHKKTRRVVRRRLMMQRAKHGTVQGTVVSTAVAVVLVPPLLAIL